MKAFSGEDFKLCLGCHDGEYEVIGGLRVTEFHLQNQLLNNTDITSGKARSLLEEGGEQALRISAQGLYTHSKAEQKIFSSALSRHALAYCLFYGENEKVQGNFMVSHYHRMGDFDAEETYEIVLESTGQVEIA